MPLTNTITVITICFNNLQELIHTCRSVESQTQKPFEHLIINGSTNSAIKDHLENNPQPAWRCRYTSICYRQQNVYRRWLAGFFHCYYAGQPRRKYPARFL